ncbi:hypothetical protein LJR153_006600 [Paenibacillus sp. LjRoot153]|uniref:hypothetical protein n=1 Tax=Paenibacillus sp. LjRoot153 TaxID=3342270 RepID=UPI003ED04066
MSIENSLTVSAVSGANEEEVRIQGKSEMFNTTEKLAKPVTYNNALNQRTCPCFGLFTSMSVPNVHNEMNMEQYKMTILSLQTRWGDKSSTFYKDSNSPYTEDIAGSASLQGRIV